ncbi:MAG: hypothetical protein ABIH42_06080 [Planctomycetota bacterium]
MFVIFTPHLLFGADINPSSDTALASLESSETNATEENKRHFNWSGLGQFRCEFHDMANESFDIMRVRFNFNCGYDYLSLFVQAGADLGNPQLLDCYTDICFSKSLNLRAGLFHVPFGWQTSISPYDLLMVDYSLIVGKVFGNTALYSNEGWDNLRDKGICMHGIFNPGSEVLFGYNVGILNGEPGSISDVDLNKAVIARVYCSVFKNMTFGVSGYDGNKLFSPDPLLSGAGTERRFSKDVYGFDLKSEAGIFLLQGEFISCTTNPVDGGGVHYKDYITRGWFIEAGIKATDKFQITGKIDSIKKPPEFWDRNTLTWKRNHSRGSTVFGVGANWYLYEFAKLQFTVQHREDEGHTPDTWYSEWKKIDIVLSVRF